MILGFLLLLLVEAGAVRREKTAEGVCESEDACASDMGVDKQKSAEVGNKDIRTVTSIIQGQREQRLNDGQTFGTISRMTAPRPGQYRGAPLTVGHVNKGLSWFVDVGNNEFKVVDVSGASKMSVKSKRDMNSPADVLGGFIELLDAWSEGDSAIQPQPGAHIFVFGTEGVRSCGFADSVEFQAVAIQLSKLSIALRGSVFPGTTWHFSILKGEEEAHYQALSVEKLQRLIQVDAMVAPGSASVQCGLFPDRHHISHQPMSARMTDNHRVQSMMQIIAENIPSTGPRVLFIGSAAYVAKAAKIVDSSKKPEDQGPFTYAEVLRLLREFERACREFGRKGQNLEGFTEEDIRSCKKLMDLLKLFIHGEDFWDAKGLLHVPSILFARQWAGTMITLADGVAYSASQNPWGAPSIGQWSTMDSTYQWEFLNHESYEIEHGGEFKSDLLRPQAYAAISHNEELEATDRIGAEEGFDIRPSQIPTMPSWRS